MQGPLWLEQGFGVFYTTTIMVNPKNNIGSYLGACMMWVNSIPFTVTIPLYYNKTPKRYWNSQDPNITKIEPSTRPPRWTARKLRGWVSASSAPKISIAVAYNNIGAEVITNTVSGVPFYSYSIMRPQNRILILKPL